jgi:hypothetical protein
LKLGSATRLPGVQLTAGADALRVVLTHTMHLADSSALSPVGRDCDQCIAYILGTHATIRHLVLSHLEKVDTETLRGINRAMRAAVNQSVTTIQCGIQAPRCETELAMTFPAATKLRVSMLQLGCSTELDACVVLEYVMATSPALLTKVLAVSLGLGIIRSCEDITPTVANFLSRCGSNGKARGPMSSN